MAKTDVMDKLVSLAKRRGFVFQSSEIYGGLGSVWDYGPLGVELKRNIKDRWWRAMVQQRDDIEGLDAAILMHPRVWEASGHIAGFTDPLVDCRQCKNRFRADDERLKGPPGAPETACPICGTRGTLTAPRMFNLMFKTFMGPVEEAAAGVYLRPETAQGIYVNYLNVLQASRQKIPFGIAQIGKAFRNEITPGNFIFRTREFEQMEMQFFVKPGTEDEWFEFWRAARMQWHRDLGVREEKLRFHAHAEDELAHYAKAAYDIEYEFPFGWHEFEGVHNRTDFDLSRHQQASGKKLEYVETGTNERFVPCVVETSVGADRTALAVLCDAYHEEEVAGEQRVVLRCNHNNDYVDEYFGFYGKQGTLLIEGSKVTYIPQDTRPQPESYSIYGWPKKLRDQYLEEWHANHPQPKPGQWKEDAQAEVFVPPPGYSDLVDHENNFFNSVRTRKPVMENEVFGNNTALGCHMSNYSYFHRTVANYDAEAKEIKG